MHNRSLPAPSLTYSPSFLFFFPLPQPPRVGINSEYQIAKLYQRNLWVFYANGIITRTGYSFVISTVTYIGIPEICINRQISSRESIAEKNYKEEKKKIYR